VSTLKLEIVTPERKVYEQEVDMVIGRGVFGEFGILPNHMPFVTPLKIAPIDVKIGDKREQIAVHGGFLEVFNNRVVVLAETAELPDDIDLDRALAAKERAERRLKAKQADIDFKRAQLALQRALNRINVAKSRH